LRGGYPGSVGWSRDGSGACSIPWVFGHWPGAGFSWSFGPAGTQWGWPREKAQEDAGERAGEGCPREKSKPKFPPGAGLRLFP